MHGRVVNLFGIGKHALLDLKTLVFTRLNLGVFDFTLLECPEIHQAQAVLLSLLEFVDSILDLFPTIESPGHGLELGAGVTVE